MLFPSFRRKASIVVWKQVLWIVVPLALYDVPFAQSTGLPCISTLDCEEKIATKGSECLDGFCSNPYHREGCLPKRLKDHYKIRTCNSEDPVSASEQGYCRPSELEYMEVRISSQNWESAFFVSWILQILLSELLDVPTTIETSAPDVHVDFYDQRTRFQYGNANDFEALRTSSQVKDCRQLARRGDDPTTNYIPCAHVNPEIWSAHMPELEQLRQEGSIETPGGLGALAHQMWFTRRKTAERHPEFVSYIGLRGDEARKKLASVFKRPTTWEKYCRLISLDGCQTPDEYAQRAPREDEYDMYFSIGAYRGYFRATEQNNCTAFPKTCTGHIVDYPCGWTSYVFPQTQHLDIALESNGNQPGSHGYSYSEMTQIWNAANETDSDVVMLWWRPEALYHQFLGTDSEFTVITLPPSTQECLANRVNQDDRCSSDPDLRLGDPRGSCMEEPHALTKGVSTALYETSFDSELPEALHSPAFEAVMNFRISDLQMGEMFELWLDKNTDTWGLDPRDAVCDWVVKNLGQIQSFIPRTHPRVVVDKDDIYKEPVFYTAIAASCFSMFATFIVMGTTYHNRTKASIRLAQIEFLLLLLIGLFLVSFAAFLLALPPSDRMCVAIVWLVNLGYTLELVPLIVKVAAIHRILVASKKMRRVKLKMVSLFGAVVLVCVAVGITLVVWTVLDPPLTVNYFTLTADQTGGECHQTIVERTYHCSSNSLLWEYLGVGWQSLLLLCASILAFQTRKIREDLNESRTLAMMIYSKFVFAILIAVTYLLDESLDPTDLAAATSLIYSLDTMTTLTIYFVPKVFLKEGIGRKGNTRIRFSIALPVGERSETAHRPHSWHGLSNSLQLKQNSVGPEQRPKMGKQPMGDGIWSSGHKSSIRDTSKADLDVLGCKVEHGLNQLPDEDDTKSFHEEDI